MKGFGGLITQNYIFTGEKRAFTRFVNMGAVAGEYSQLQLWNPAGSGVIVILRNFYGYADGTTAEIRITQYDTALSTLNGTGYNKYIAEAVSSGQVRSQSNGAIFGTRIAVTPKYPLASYPFSWGDQKDHYIISENKGICVVQNEVNKLIGVNFEWIEI